MREWITSMKQALSIAKEELLDFAEDIRLHPELGYREIRTKEKVSAAFSRHHLRDTEVFGLTGVKGRLPGMYHPGMPTVAIIGEMDAVPCPSHPDADPDTKAAHACGHHAGLTAMLGAGLILQTACPELSGNVCLIAAPAEEYVELEYRKQLLTKGKIHYLGGKQELIREGCFENIDLAMMVHAQTDCDAPTICVSSTAGGFVGKSVRFIGKEAHAGGAPHLGINALGAASAALTCIGLIRETFRDEDHVRVHPIITKGGDAVNTVPADVRMESYVRAAGMEAMKSANNKVNRAIRGAAYAVGAAADIEDLPGYLPLDESAPLSDLFAGQVSALFPDARLLRSQPFCGSTDMGDLSWLLPVIQPTISGFRGALHSRDFAVTDTDWAYLVPALLMAATTADLLAEGGTHARQVMAAHPRHSREEYDALWESFFDANAAN